MSNDLAPLINVIYKRYKEYKHLDDFRKGIISKTMKKYKLSTVSTLTQLIKTAMDAGDVGLVTSLLAIKDSEDKRVALVESIEEVANLLYNYFINSDESYEFLVPDFMDFTEEDEEYYKDILSTNSKSDFSFIEDEVQLGKKAIYNSHRFPYHISKKQFCMSNKNIC